jgi:hypothetical protein
MMKILLLALTVVGVLALSGGSAGAFHNACWCGHYKMDDGPGIVSPWGSRIMGYDYPRWRIGGESAIPLSTPGMTTYELLDATNDFPTFGLRWSSSKYE